MVRGKRLIMSSNTYPKSSIGSKATQDTILEEVVETEKHLHNVERWAAVAASPSGETNVADFDTMTAFQMDAGNDTWGSWLQVLGSADTPVTTGMTKFDPHRMMILDVERDVTATRIQIAWGATGAAGLAAGDYTEILIAPLKSGRHAPFDIMCKRIAVTTKVWCRCWVSGQNTGTVDFYLGLHEYEE